MIRLVTVLLFMLALLPSAQVFAQNGNETSSSEQQSADRAAHDGEHRQYQLNFFDLGNDEAPALVAVLFNFALLCLVVYFILRRPVRGMFHERRERLKEAIEEAEQAKQLAEKAMSEARVKSDALDLEMARLRSEVLQSGKDEAGRINVETERQAERLRADTRVLIEQEVHRLAGQVREEIVEEIVRAAQRIITEQVDQSDQERLTREFLQALQDNRSLQRH